MKGAAREAAARWEVATRIGTGVPTRQRCFAAIVTRWSHAHETEVGELHLGDGTQCP